MNDFSTIAPNTNIAKAEEAETKDAKSEATPNGPPARVGVKDSRRDAAPR